MMYLVVLTLVSCIIANARDIPTVNTENSNHKHNVKYLVQSGELKNSSVRDSSRPIDCEDVLRSGQRQSGIYSVYPVNRLSSESILVYCDMETDGGGWTVLQRRGDFTRDRFYFFQDWNAYKRGFGNLEEDFWLGNDYIYALSNQKRYSIRFDLGTADKKRAYAVYNSFYIDDEYHGYALHVTGYSGTAGDAFGPHNNLKFTTRDRDNDLSRWENCAERWKGGWWFNACCPACLNGPYYTGKPPEEWAGIIWEKWLGSRVSLAITEMKIRQSPPWIKFSDPLVDGKF